MNACVAVRRIHPGALPGEAAETAQPTLTT
jgi:hypothetical protein